MFRSGVDLVTLDVAVTGKDGKPLKGLSAADFVVTLDGKRRAVRALEYLEFGASPHVETAATPGAIANQFMKVSPFSGGGRVIVLLFDDLATRPGEARLLLVAADRMLDSLDAGDLVGVTTTSGLGSVLSPTRDRAAVRAILRHRDMVGRYDDNAAPFYISIKEAIEISQSIRGVSQYVAQRECAIVNIGAQCPSMVHAAAKRVADITRHRAAMQFAAYADVIRALGAAPRPRVLIALSVGVAVGAEGNIADSLNPVVRAAAAAGVQFFSLTEIVDTADVRDVSGTSNPLHDRPRARIQENEFLISGMQTVAAAVGGEAFRVIGQADRFFTRILWETSGLYQLGVELPAELAPGRLLKVTVSVSRPGVTVRTSRNTVVSAAPATPVPIEDALRTRIAQGGLAFGVPLAVGTALRRGAGADELQLGFEAEVPATVTSPIRVMFAFVDRAGRVVNAGQREWAGGQPDENARFTFTVPLATGPYRLRVAVADGRGNIGSIERAIMAELTRFGSVRASDLMTTWTGADGQVRFLGLDTLPGGAKTVRAVLELYPDDSRPSSPLTVRYSLSRGEEPTPIVEEETTPSGPNGVLTATTTIAVGQLAPGLYTIRATVLSGGLPAGTITKLLRR